MMKVADLTLLLPTLNYCLSESYRASRPLQKVSSDEKLLSALFSVLLSHLIAVALDLILKTKNI